MPTRHINFGKQGVKIYDNNQRYNRNTHTGLDD